MRVRLKRIDNAQAELVVEDDGIGRRDGAPARGTGLGTKLVAAMAGALRGSVEYVARHPGTTGRLVFPLGHP